MKYFVRIAFLLPAALLCGLTALPSTNAMATTQEIHLQCDGETRSRLLAFTASDLKTEVRLVAERRLRIEIRGARRASVLDMPSGETLFGPSQCRMSEMKLACETSEDGHHRQMFISRTSGDAMFGGYTETSDEKSAVVVERYSCVKEDREPIF